MRLMGLSDVAYWGSWFVYYLAISTVISIGATVFLTINIFVYSNKFLFFLFLWLYGISLFGYVIFIQSFFAKARSASIVSSLLFFLSSFIDQAVSNNSISPSLKSLASVIQTVAMKRSIQSIVYFENGYQGLSFSTISLVYNNYSIQNAFYLFIGMFFSGGIVGIYLSKVLPQGDQSRSPIYFCFLRGFWCPKKRNRVAKCQSDNEKEEQVAVESSDFELKCNLKLREEYYEKMTREDLLKQESENQILLINNLSKTFNDGFKAVEGLSLKMYQGQIFALLGHNGAGKTTTISMLTGLIEASTGSAKMFSEELIGLKSTAFIGICQQHNVLFDYLTPREHLSIFCEFKGVSRGEANKQIDKMIIDIDLVSSQNTIAKNLSGGNKRKLSVAIALIGGSKLVLLDEPTAGMDIGTRRRLWNMLREYRQDRVIILTTHYMDEADILGDRIGIMSQGAVVCLGSSLFLKKRLGVGYKLTIQMQKEVQNRELRLFELDQLIKEKMGERGVKGNEKMQNEIKVVKQVDDEIVYQIPYEFAGKFKDFFEEFDQKLEALKIISYGISITTLEEVFLNVGNIVNNENQINPMTEFSSQQVPASNKQSNDSNENLHKSEEYDKFDEFRQIQFQQPVKTILRHFKALFKKRILVFKRSLKSLILEIIIPVILVLIGYSFSKIQFYFDSPERLLDLSLLPLKQRILINQNLLNFSTSVNDLSTSTIVQNLPDSYTAFTPYYKNYSYSSPINQSNVQPLADFNNDVYSQKYNGSAEPFRYGSYLIYEANNKTKQFKVASLINVTSQDAAGLYPQFIYESILKLATGNEKLEFKVFNAPFPVSATIKNKKIIANGMFIVFVVAIGFALIPASIVGYLIQERETKVKHLQVVSGINLVAYWTSNLLFDLAKAYFPVFIVIVIVQYLMEYDEVWKVFMLYPVGVVPFTYVTSYFFNNENSSQTFTIFMHFVFSGIGPIVVFILRTSYSTFTIGNNLLWILKLVPSFCLTNSLIYASNKSLLIQAQPGISSDPMDIYNMKGDILFLILHFIVFLFLLVIIESRVVEKRILPRCQKSKKQGEANLNKENSQRVEEEDIINEAHRVSNQSEPDFISVRHFSKSYNQINSLCHKKNKQKVIAIEDLSFGLNKGECLGLLGVNGAGKTTFFKSLTGEVTQSGGELLVNGFDNLKQFREIVGQIGIGYCPQEHALFDGLTVTETLDFYAELKGIANAEIKKGEIEKQIKQLRLEQFRNKQVQQLSGGNKRKLQVAIALLANPQIILLDEPSAGMDPEARSQMWRVIKEESKNNLGRNGSAIILTTHSMEEAEALSSKMGIMVKQGVLKCFGSSQHIRNKFGKGFEIEIKFIKGSNATMDKVSIGCEITKLTEGIDKLNEILDAKEREFAERQLSEFGIGKDLLKVSRHDDGMIDGKRLNMYIEQCQKLYHFLKLLFEGDTELSKVEIIEHFDDYYKIRLPKEGNNQIGFFFGLVEHNKEKLGLSEYSIQQASLEQIFQTIANGGVDSVSIHFVIFQGIEKLDKIIKIERKHICSEKNYEQNREINQSSSLNPLLDQQI